MKISSFPTVRGFSPGKKSRLCNPFRELSVAHVGMTRNFSPVVKVTILWSFFCILQTTGLPHKFHHSHHHNVTQFPYPHHLIPYPSTPTDLPLHDQPFRLDSSLDNYDPVEAYHQLRRHYLTSTSRVDRAHYGIGAWDSSPSRTRHHSHIQSTYHRVHTPQNYQDGSDRDNNRNDNDRNYGQIKGESAHYPRREENAQHFILNQQKCYVCLPPNKGSREAKDILGMFGKTDPREIADCAEFTQANAKGYEFNCPPGFGGCILRIHGLNVSRSCSKYRLNDCKKANSVEFCYCTEPLCNDVKPAPVPFYTSGEEDDDEDGGGSGERSTKEEETPSDSELLSPSSSSGNIKNKNKDSVALANFNDNGPSENEDVSGLTEGDSSPSSGSSLPKCPAYLVLSLVLWWVVVCGSCWSRVMFITNFERLGQSDSVKSVRAKTTFNLS